MIELPFYHELPVAVFGLGKSGLASAHALQNSGAEVRAWDDSEDRRADAEKAGIPVVDLYHCDWREITSLIISPGIPNLFPEPHPIAKLARDHNCEVIGDIELLGRAQRDAKFVGITGTNGKSTTTALIGHVVEFSGRSVAVGGNLGIPALKLEALDSSGIYVLEMSSYQLELTLSITFDVAVLLNISPDHLERHGGMEGYIRAKRLIFHRQTSPRTAVIGVDDSHCESICKELLDIGDQNVIPVSGHKPVSGGVYVEGGTLYDDTDGKKVPTVNLREVASLPGAHNWQNAAAAYAACRAAGIDPPVIIACLRSFPGLPHRQEVVSIVDGVAYINDSKATNADAATKALTCYDVIYWIAGGRPKGETLEGFAPDLQHIRHAFLIGEAEDLFASALEGKVPYTRCGNLDDAVARAAELACGDKSKGAVVLLSPGCSSFDHYQNFEARGDAFRALVKALPGDHQEPDSIVATYFRVGSERGLLQ